MCLPIFPLRRRNAGESRCSPRIKWSETCCPASVHDGAEAEGEDELSIAGGKIDLAGEGDVAVFGARVLPLHLEVRRKILPAVGGADESDRHFFPGH